MFSSPVVLDVTMGHRGMQKEVSERFGIDGPFLSVDIRPAMTNGMTPDIVADSRNLPLESGVFDLVLFDPPFSFHGGKSCGTGDYKRFYMTYGLNIYKSRAELGEYIESEFQEIHRVLRVGGICLFKWSESRIKLDFPLGLIGSLCEEKRWQRPSKYWGTKTGTATWYVWLVKPNVKGEREHSDPLHPIVRQFISPLLKEADLEITHEMLSNAIKKAVEVGLIPQKEVDIDTYMKTWDAMKAILDAAINSV